MSEDSFTDSVNAGLHVQHTGSGPLNSNFGSGSQTNNSTINAGNFHIRARIVNVYEREHSDKYKNTYRETVNWLSPPDPTSNHATALDRHDPDTCGWLLRHEQYKRWKTGEIQHLWLHGKAGCGKTVLSSQVIDDLSEHLKDNARIGLAYFYFTFSDHRKQSYDELLLALVCQLGAAAPALAVFCQMQKRSSISRPHAQEMEASLIDIIGNFDEVLIVLDALDESPEVNSQRRTLLRSLKKLTSQAPRLRLFATSRYLQDISEWLGSFPVQQIALQPSHVSDDIQQYVTNQLQHEPELQRFTPRIKSMIKENVSGNADGMFRWAYLLLEELIKLKSSAPKAIENALKQFPRDLDSIYARILTEIAETDRTNAFTLLRWITYATRPLTLNELIETLIIDPEQETVDLENRGDLHDPLRILGSLVCVISTSNEDDWLWDWIGDIPDRSLFSVNYDFDSVRSSNDGEDTLSSTPRADTKIRLAHFTVQEYLESSRIQDKGARQFHLELGTANHFLTTSCLTYIICCSVHV